MTHLPEFPTNSRETRGDSDSLYSISGVSSTQIRSSIRPCRDIARAIYADKAYGRISIASTSPQDRVSVTSPKTPLHKNRDRNRIHNNFIVSYDPLMSPHSHLKIFTQAVASLAFEFSQKNSPQSGGFSKRQFRSPQSRFFLGLCFDCIRRFFWRKLSP